MAPSGVLTVNHKWGFELKELFYQEALYLEAQQEAGVSHSLVSPVPQLFLYDLAEEITDELSFVYNKALAGWVKNTTAAFQASAPSR